jgi:hypothetical protein
LKKEEELLYLILEKNLYPNLCGIGKKLFPQYNCHIIAILFKYSYFCHILAIVGIKAPIIAKLYFSISLFYQ